MKGTCISADLTRHINERKNKEKDSNSKTLLCLLLLCLGFLEVFEEIFNGPTPVFVASLVPELFTCLLENSQREHTTLFLTKFFVSMLLDKSNLYTSYT